MKKNLIDIEYNNLLSDISLDDIKAKFTWEIDTSVRNNVIETVKIRNARKQKHRKGKDSRLF